MGVGSTLGLVDLLDAADAVWAELPIAAQGTTTTEFESYEPFLLGGGGVRPRRVGLGHGDLAGDPRRHGTDAGAMASLASDVERALEEARAAATRDEPGAVPVLRGTQADSGLPALLDEAAASHPGPVGGPHADLPRAPSSRARDAPVTDPTHVLIERWAVTAAALVAGTLVAARQVTSELSASLREGGDR